MQALLTLCINFTPVKVADSKFPSGFHIEAATAYPGSDAATISIERVSNRQTGRIWVAKAGRKKVAI